MKLINVLQNDSSTVGIQTEKGILDLEKAARKFNYPVPTKIMDLIRDWKNQKAAVHKLVESALNGTDNLFFDETKLTYGPCVPDPEKILCIGLNYRQHAKESNTDIPVTPILFSKFNNALTGHNSTVTIPKVAQKVDYEVELVIVIGETIQNISQEEALTKVFGYCVGNDLSARDLQMKTSQWLLGKTCDGFAPLGKYLVTADEIQDPNNLNMETYVNGELRQSSNTSDMIFNCAYLVSYLSQFMTLKPGDLIFTGTPQGVILGYPEDKQVWLKAGDEVITKIENLGELKITLA